EQFVVEAGAEYPALALVERRAEFFIVLYFGDQRLRFSRRGVISGRDIVQLVVDDIAFGEKLGPEIGLRLIVLEVRDRSGGVGREFAEAADRPGRAVASGRQVQRAVALNDIDDIEQIVV